MSSTAISANLLSQATPSYFQQRRADLQQLGQDLESGNLSAAQQDFSNLQTLAQSGPFGGDAFKLSGRQQDFSALGQALQSGDLSSAQQAYSQLESTFDHRRAIPPPTVDGGGLSSTGSPSSSVSSSPTGSEIVLNLGTLTPGEQIDINISNGANGSEQVSVGISGQGSTPEQITLNLNPSSNQELVLNLFNNSGSTSSSSSSSQGSGLSVNA